MPFRAGRAGTKLKECLDRGARQGDGVFAGLTTFFGGGTRRRAGKIRQPGKVALFKKHREGFLIGQHILAELRAEACETLIDCSKTILRMLLDTRTRPHETGVIAIKHPRLLGIKAECIARFCGERRCAHRARD